MKTLFNEATTANWITEPTTDTQYAIERTEDTLTIKFQWTVSKLDWIYNFMFIPFFIKRPYSNMPKIFFVHRGFIKKYKAVRSEIQRAVLDNINKKIEIYGYSQGAALAVLCHEDIVFTFNKHPKTVVFGCPRVFSLLGFKELKNRLNGVTRYEYGNDIVTKVPLWPYRHYGEKIHIGNKRKWWKLSVKDHMKYKNNC